MTIRIDQCSYLSHKVSQKILLHNYKTLVKGVSVKISKYNNNPLMLHGSHNLGYQLWFCIWLITKTCRVLLHLSRCYRIFLFPPLSCCHYVDVIMTTMAPQITSTRVVYSTVYSDPDQRKHQSSASLACVWGNHRDRWIPHTKGQLRGKCFHLMTSSCRILKLMLSHHGEFFDGRFPAISSSTPRKCCTPG